ncbi:hypothetical protein [Singulisphaera sp. GP187]|uniref:hypothetical protein n=1 Tax=Singulisphaera sp. GP187 TaxID=1882752 RepID=UPI0020B15819|nr:hypothetical protein [Singulisphaera sp. GP187]
MGSRARRRSATPVVEALETRQLLSLYTGPSSTRPIASNGSLFTISVTGGGYQTVKRLKGGQFAINLFATNPNSALTITAQPRQAHFNTSQIKIGKIDVKTGLLGSIDAGAANLLGPMSALQGSVSSIQLGSIGRNATVDVSGDLGKLNAASVELGPTGRIHVGGNLTGSVGGSINLDGGRFVVDNDATGTFNPASLIVQHGGVFAVGHDLSGGFNVGGDIQANTNGLINIGHDLGGLTLGRGLSLQGGRLIVGNDIKTAATVANSVKTSDNGLLFVGRDIAGGLTVNGDLTLDSGGSVIVGRDLDSLTVGGDFDVKPTGGLLAVKGNLVGLTVNGALNGKGSPTAVDLFVGLDLSNLAVLGGGASLGGIQEANLDVGKNLSGLNVRHGIFKSFITAGVLIDGTGSGASGAAANIGADGVDAVLNSELRAGVEIRNLTIGGDVRSEFALNPNATGYPTRIIAGEDRQGHYLTGGNIDNFQILGSLIDSVIAASVAPSGGNGTLPPSGYGPPPIPSTDPGDGTYDAPAGVIFGGSVAAPVPYINYTEITYFNETFKEIAYNRQLDPVIDDSILPGTINVSFASRPLTQAQLNDPSVTTTNSGGGTSTTGTTTLNLPLPTKSTVLGGVVSHTHVGEADFAGIFAADTRGVFIGTLPDR